MVFYDQSTHLVVDNIRSNRKATARKNKVNLMTKVVSTLVVKSAQMCAKIKYRNYFPKLMHNKYKCLIILFSSIECSCLNLDIRYQLLNEAYPESINYWLG